MMLKLPIAIVFLCGPIAAVERGVSREPQALPGFSGDWVLTSMSPERPGYDHFWLGTETTVRHDGASLTITRINPPPGREAKFTLNGDESRNEYVVNGQKIVRDSRATSSRGTLLISTDTTTADGQRWLSNISRWSLDPDGSLVVGDTEICGKGECPSVVTTLKFKRKTGEPRPVHVVVSLHDTGARRLRTGFAERSSRKCFEHSSRVFAPCGTEIARNPISRKRCRWW